MRLNKWNVIIWLWLFVIDGIKIKYEEKVANLFHTLSNFK